MEKRSTAGRLHQWIAGLLIFGFICLYACVENPSRAAGLKGTVPNSAPAAGIEEAQNAGDQENKLHLPEASGTVVYEGQGVTIDASHTDQGYVMIRCEPVEKRLKARISTEAQVYYYNLPSGGDYSVFPLQMGGGEYTLRVMEQVEDDLYAVRYSVQIEVTLTSETVPFIYPNQYVWYNAESSAVSASNALVQNLTEEEIVETCYRFVVKNLTYDTKKALNVESGYLPDADETLESKTGICFDYSVLLAAMLRAQGIPARVMIGMVSPENLYHAWNSVYLDGEWIWMDATLDGTGHKERDYVAEKIY
jgi:hypothetical protein